MLPRLALGPRKCVALLGGSCGADIATAGTSMGQTQPVKDRFNCEMLAGTGASGKAAARQLNCFKLFREGTAFLCIARLR
jgi:hypothetical protein